jgi:CDP-paratose 2-epimerase
MGQVRVLVTGSCGLIGSEVCLHFHQAGYSVLGIDNNQRAVFFGPEGDTSWSLQRLRQDVPGYEHHDIDIRDREGILRLVASTRPALSCILRRSRRMTAQPRSHSTILIQMRSERSTYWRPRAAGRRSRPLFICRRIKFTAIGRTRWHSWRRKRAGTMQIPRPPGLPESFSIDQSLHSLFGASKVASDVMVQEYGRYFGMPTCALRGGCLTGPNHSGVELHGFLSYRIRCNLTGKEYRVFGYKGKQVRDNIHSEDVARFMLEFAQKPRCGEVYNLGGGFENSCSILEAFVLAAEVSGRKQVWTYVESNRIGDHICYYSDLTKMKTHYPGWGITKSLKQTVAEIAASWSARLPDPL